MLTRFLALALLAAGLSFPVLADDYQYRARAALEAGEILPLDAILRAIAARVSGTVIDVELERDDGIWLYWLELRTDNGYIAEVEVDAASARILEIEIEEDD